MHTRADCVTISTSCLRRRAVATNKGDPVGAPLAGAPGDTHDRPYGRPTRATARVAPTGGCPRWLKSRETLLYQGQADKIADELEKTARKGAVNAEQLNTAAGYFRTNHQRMNYIEMREEEWPIGSGMVESGAKQFKARFSGPGMRWSRQGAENLLPVRAAVLSGRFDQMWDAAKNLPPS